MKQTIKTYKFNGHHGTILCDWAELTKDNNLVSKLRKPFSKPTEYNPSKVSYKLTVEEVTKLLGALNMSENKQAPWIKTIIGTLQA